MYVALRGDEGWILCQLLPCTNLSVQKVTAYSKNLFIGKCSSDQPGNAILWLPGKEAFPWEYQKSSPGAEAAKAHCAWSQQPGRGGTSAPAGHHRAAAGETAHRQGPVFVLFSKHFAFCFLFLWSLPCQPGSSVARGPALLTVGGRFLHQLHSTTVCAAEPWCT